MRYIYFTRYNDITGRTVQATHTRGSHVKERHGQFIRIYWECGEPAVYVRGHVTNEEFRATISAQGINPERYGDPVQAYARYVPSRSDDFDMQIFDCTEPGAGRFAVTRADERQS